MLKELKTSEGLRLEGLKTFDAYDLTVPECLRACVLRVPKILTICELCVYLQYGTGIETNGFLLANSVATVTKISNKSMFWYVRCPGARYGLD